MNWLELLIRWRFQRGFRGFSWSPLRVKLFYPRHLCRAVYRFRLFIHPFVCWSIRDSVPFAELLQRFTLNFFKCGISHQPLIRKHSCLDHRYHEGLAFIPWLLTPRWYESLLGTHSFWWFCHVVAHLQDKTSTSLPFYKWMIRTCISVYPIRNIFGNTFVFSSANCKRF